MCRHTKPLLTASEEGGRQAISPAHPIFESSSAALPQDHKGLVPPPGSAMVCPLVNPDQGCVMAKSYKRAKTPAGACMFTRSAANLDPGDCSPQPDTPGVLGQ